MTMRFQNWRIEDLRTGKEIAIRTMDERTAKAIAKEKFGFQFPKCSGHWTENELKTRGIDIVQMSIFYRDGPGANC